MANSDRIDAAVRACLDLSRRSVDQVATMRGFLEHLRASAAWSEEDVNAIEERLKQILLPEATQLDGADESGE